MSPEVVVESVTGPSIRFTGLTLSLGGVSVLEEISFQVAPGAMHCLIGPNGAGKTSLLRSLLGQMPHEGRIEISWRGPRRLGYVPQRIDVDATLPISVRDFLAISFQNRPAFLGLSRELQAHAKELLERLGLSGKETRLLGQLSGGERQRLLFAQALIPRPALLLLDEPMANVDRHGAQLIQTEVMRLQREGTTVLWVHHDLKLVKEIATEVTCINRTLRFTGHPAKVLDAQHVLEAYSQ